MPSDAGSTGFVGYISWLLAGMNILNIGGSCFVQLVQNDFACWKLHGPLVCASGTMLFGFSFHGSDYECVGLSDCLLAESCPMEVVVAGIGKEGSFVGIAETKTFTDEIYRNFFASYNIKVDSAVDGCFLGKVLVDGERLLLAPVSCIFKRRGKLLRDLNEDQEALWSRKCEKQDEWNKNMGMLSGSNSSGNFNFGKRAVSFGDLEDLDDMAAELYEGESGRINGGSGEVVIDFAVSAEVQPQEENPVWSSICSNNVRTENHGSGSSLRRILLGNYVVKRSLENGHEERIDWLPEKKKFDDVLPAESSKPKKRLKISGNGLIGDLKAEKTLDCSVSVLYNQWFWEVSRKLIWDSKILELSECPFIGWKSQEFLKGESFEEGKLRAKWEMNKAVDVDLGAFGIWDKLRLSPIGRPKKRFFMVFCWKKLDAMRFFFNDVSNMWASHNFGSHTPFVKDVKQQEAKVDDVIIEASSSALGYVDGFSKCISSFITDVGESLSSIILYVVWPKDGKRGDLLSFFKCLSGLDALVDEGVIQLIPESFVSEVSPKTYQLTKCLIFELFSFSSQYRKLGVARDPCFVLSHDLLSKRSHPSLHMSFCTVGKDRMFCVVTNPTGEIWNCMEYVGSNMMDCIRLCLGCSLPENLKLKWNLILISVDGCNLEGVGGLPSNINAVASCTIEKNFSVCISNETGKRLIRIPTVDCNAFVVANNSKSLILKVDKKCDFAKEVAEDLLIMMNERSPWPKHVELCWDVKKSVE